MRARTVHGPLERQARGVLREAAQLVRRLERLSTRPLAAAAEALIASLEAGHTVYFCGNGGSAADAQHLACELAGRFLSDRPALPAVALSTNTSSLTAIGNDYGFDQVFSRQLEGLGRSGDVNSVQDQGVSVSRMPGHFRSADPSIRLGSSSKVARAAWL